MQTTSPLHPLQPLRWDAQSQTWVPVPPLMPWPITPYQPATGGTR